MENNYFYTSPIGLLEIKANETGIVSVLFTDKINSPKENYSDNIFINATIKQLDEYFNGQRKTFELKLNFNGTEFQNTVWRQLQRINFGSYITYLQQSRLMNNEKGIRAFASANGKNPFAIIIPCHRVVGSNGKLTGYAGGLNKKRWLLEFENARHADSNVLF